MAEVFYNAGSASGCIARLVRVDAVIASAPPLFA